MREEFHFLNKIVTFGTIPKYLACMALLYFHYTLALLPYMVDSLSWPKRPLRHQRRGTERSLRNLPCRRVS